MFLIVSITGINIKEIMAKMLIKDKPVDSDNIAILLISNEYLQIFNLLHFLLLIE